MNDPAQPCQAAIDATNDGDAHHFGARYAALLLVEYIAAQFLGSALIGAVIGALYGGGGGPLPAPLRMLALAYGAVAGIVLGALTVVLHTRYLARPLFGDASARGLAWTRPLPGGGPIAVVTGIALGLAFILVLHFLPPTPNAMTGPLGQLSQGSRLAQLVVVVIALFVAPFIEEFLFRGAMFAAIARSWGVGAAIALTTLLFLAIHIPDKMHYWPGFIAVGLLALIACLLRLRYRSLVPAIALHFVYNLALLVFGAAL